MSCLRHVFVPLLPPSCCSQAVRFFFSLWLRTKPKCLEVYNQTSLETMDSLDLPYLENGLFFPLSIFFFFIFVLKEMLCTCQVYCMKVITEPWRKYLNDALVMCCSDNFSFQSEINYCFIMNPSSCVCFLSFFLICCVMENIYQITDDPLVKTFWAKKNFIFPPFYTNILKINTQFYLST